MQFYEDDKFDPPAPDSALSVVGQLLKYFIGVVVVVLIIYAFVTGAPINTKPNSGARSTTVQSDLFTVEYRVYGTAADVNVHYENQTGGNEDRESIKMPWSYTFQRKPKEWLYVSAYNWSNSGTITCEIRINGVVQETQSSTGGGSVTCSGRWY